MIVPDKAEIPSEPRLKPGKNNGFLAICLCVLLIFLNTAGCRSSEESPAETPAKIEMSPRQVVGIGRIEPELRFLDLSSETTGSVARINCAPGDFITGGEVIVELSTSLEIARVEQSTARIQSQRSQIEAAKASLSAIMVKTENARVSFNRAKELFENNTESEAVFDTAKAEFDALREDVKRFQAELVTAENILKENQADLKLAQAELERRFIRAPRDGQLLTLEVTLGSLISPETVFAVFAPESPRVARCEIDELFAALVQSGQKASLRNQGTTEVLANGKVTFVAPSFTRKSLFSDDVGDLEDRRVREIWITLEPGSALLYGSRIECVIALQD
ncbi:MAG: HlyD family efflux transporter periplasmic adaptor subunit [Candidatus Aminicenantaceae bacterium]